MHQSKVEQAQEKMEELRKELRTEVQDEVRSNVRTRTLRRFVMRIGGCCGIYLLALLTIPVLAGYVVARTGLVPVPWLGDRVAHERNPSRVVVAHPVQAEELFAKKFRAAVHPGERPTQITVSFSESELTGFFRSILEDRGSFTPEMRAVSQVALERDHAELFMRIPAYGGGGTTVRIRGTPTVRDGKFALDLREVAVGNLGVPRFLAQTLVNSYLGQMMSMSTVDGDSGAALALERITLAGAHLQMTFRVRAP